MTTPRDTEVQPTTPPSSADAEADAAAVSESSIELTSGSLSDYLRAWGKRIRAGESGVLPVLVGLVIIIVIFQTQQSVFLSAGNLTVLLQQAAAVVLLGMAEVYVLLLGEIDLSVGFVGAIGGTITVILTSTPHNLPWWVGVLAGLAGTALIGAFQGWLITWLRLPSFVVTLAGLLGFNGVLLLLINKAGGSSGGTIAISNSVILGIVNSNMAPIVGWIVLAVSVAVFALVTLLGDRSRRRSGLATPPFSLAVAKIVLFAVAGVILVVVCNTNRGVGVIALSGVPYVVPVVLAILLVWTVLLGRTRFGRYVYAIGGNAEAARRAGINVSRIRLACFVLCSLTGGMAGIVYASRLGSISNNVNGGQLVLYAVAAAVIGGTSLFGGRGKMLHALLGGMIIATIANGMGLIGLDAATQYIVTALVLLAAVIVDAVARRGQSVSA
ncbi:MAG TPA: ABC transporter permease [Nocardioidaceae bacterium]|nr:ABC transporter permease [Nocardioidaceae bacterium]